MIQRCPLSTLAVSACLLASGCGKSVADPADSLRAFAQAAFARAASDNRLTAEFQLEPPRVRVAKEISPAPPTAEVVVSGVDRVIKGDDVAGWLLEKRDRVKGGGRGRIKLARDSGDDGKRSFVFIYAYQDGAWSLKDQKCQGRGYLPEELKRYFELKAPSP
ncbi:MAG TPA: hypothetical protein VMV10_13545 [Pirellulales bacterium]|nr:hypothetical protein [Pirellulales bacterium]